MKKQFILFAALIPIVLVMTACGVTETRNEALRNANTSECSDEDECVDSDSCDEDCGSENTSNTANVSNLEAVIDETSTYGSSGALQDEDLTFEDMLLYAIQDEFAARSEYEVIINELNTNRPYTNIIKSEEKHIEELISLYETYGIKVPDDNSLEQVLTPKDLLTAARTGVQAEVNNIAMYDLFLQQDLPEDVKAIFIDLRSASIKHLSTFERQAERLS